MQSITVWLFGLMLLFVSVLPHAQAQPAFSFAFGTQGSAPGQFDRPLSVATDSSGRILVADTHNKRIQVFDASGTFQFEFGSLGSLPGQFNFPLAITTDSANRIIVAESYNQRIQVFDATGTFLFQFGSRGSGPGQFINPNDVATDSANRIIVADTVNHRIQVFDPSGTFLSQITRIAGGKPRRFRRPLGVATDNADNIIVADEGNDRIVVFDSTGAFQFQFGSPGTRAGQFQLPSDVAVDRDGRIIVTDRANNRVQVFNVAGVFEYVLGSGGSGPGQFKSPYGVVTDSSNRYIIADTINNRVQVFGESAADFTCEMRTDWDPGNCARGTFQVFSLADLDAYEASNYGKASNSRSRYTNLRIMSDLDAPILDIESPCQLSLADGIKLSGDFVSLDGRRGVTGSNGYTITAKTACVLSEQDNARIMRGSTINVDDLTVAGQKWSWVGDNAEINAAKSFKLISTGNTTTSYADIRAGATINAGTLEVSAPRRARFDARTVITADTIRLTSTGNWSDSHAEIMNNVKVTARHLTLSAHWHARISEICTVTLTGDLNVVSTGRSGTAFIKFASNLSVGGDMNLSSARGASIERNVNLQVAGNLNMDAESPATCTFGSSIHVTYGSKSGVCAPLLP